ncbi:MAG: NAD(P)-dependent oxidoreductase, partial [Alphaproteobacteria bacterium]|nr:NAD(P)-dependent oxidoreductase [Alphaproteobacteria bacterium]
MRFGTVTTAEKMLRFVAVPQQPPAKRQAHVRRQDFDEIHAAYSRAKAEEAYELAQATNTFPGIYGRLCPQDRLCEGNCAIEKGFESVTIGSGEKHISDTAWG